MRHLPLTFPREPSICPRCSAAPLQVIWVHGHGQCVTCKQNILPCCDGSEQSGEGQ